MLQEQVRQLTEENKRLIARIEKQDQQIKEKDQQIANWTSQSAIISKLANDSHNVAQKLLESSNSSVDSDNEEPSSVEEVNNQSNENVKKSSNSWFNRLFKRK